MHHHKTYARLRMLIAADVSFLRDKPEETPDSTLRALWLAAKGTLVSAEAAMHGELPTLDSQQLAAVEQMVSQRIQGVPLSHITGRQRFMDMEMLVGPGALVPRKETELLGSAALRLTREAQSCVGTPLVVDVCTGSGNIALAVAHHVPAARVFAADLSEAAVELARRNAEHLQLDGRVRFEVGDLLKPFDNEAFIGRVDVLTCNPPYITSTRVKEMPQEIAAHEPRLAFDGGALGVSIVMQLVSLAPRFLRPGGWLAFEVGLGQGAPLAKRLAATHKFKEVVGEKDGSGEIRVILASC